MIATPNEIKKAGIKALVDALGVSGMIRFIQQYELGEGDYTKERQSLKSDIKMSDVKEFVNSRKK